VRRIAEEHGGQIEEENRAEGGARVRIDLPLSELGRPAAVQRSERKADTRRERA
jgi:K+-sensing histidine kinase KdpD